MPISYSSENRFSEFENQEEKLKESQRKYKWMNVDCGGKTYKLITTYKCPAGISINSFQSCAFSVNRRNFYNVVGVFVLNDCASAFFLSRTRLL